MAATYKCKTCGMALKKAAQYEGKYFCPNTRYLCLRSGYYKNPTDL